MINDRRASDGLMTHEPGMMTDPTPESSDTGETRVAAGQWALDPGSSTATFSVHNLGLKVVHGSVPISRGVAEVSAEGTLSSVHAELALGQVDTGNHRRDLDLAKPHLLDTARYPTMSFDGAGSESLVSGVLSVRGAQIPLELRTTVTSQGPDEVTVTATTGFDRSPLGMKVPRIAVGRWIDVAISAVFRRDLG
jgi:polyisoprenoid-binding protein YceI